MCTQSMNSVAQLASCATLHNAVLQPCIGAGLRSARGTCENGTGIQKAQDLVQLNQKCDGSANAGLKAEQSKGQVWKVIVSVQRTDVPMSETRPVPK